MNASKVEIGHTCGNIGTINPYTEYFKSEDPEVIAQLAALVNADQTEKHYGLMSNATLRSALAAFAGRPLPVDSFVWFSK